MNLEAVKQEARDGSLEALVAWTRATGAYRASDRLELLLRRAEGGERAEAAKACGQIAKVFVDDGDARELAALWDDTAAYLAPAQALGGAPEPELSPEPVDEDLCRRAREGDLAALVAWTRTTAEYRNMESFEFLLHEAQDLARPGAAAQARSDIAAQLSARPGARDLAGLWEGTAAQARALHLTHDRRRPNPAVALCVIALAAALLSFGSWNLLAALRLLDLEAHGAATTGRIATVETRAWFGAATAWCPSVAYKDGAGADRVLRFCAPVRYKAGENMRLKRDPATGLAAPVDGGLAARENLFAALAFLVFGGGLLPMFFPKGIFFRDDTPPQGGRDAPR